MTAGILNVSEFFFIITEDQRVVVTTVKPGKLRRDIPVPEGFLIIPAERPTVPSRQRCFPGQSPVSKGITPSNNGCGPEGGFHGIDLVPDFNFGSCCDKHDTCFGTCSETFSSCNNEFLSCAVGRCLADFFLVPKLALACSNIALFYYGAISVGGGSAFRAATEKHCECKCDDPALTACDDKCINTQNDPENCGKCFFHVSIPRSPSSSSSTNMPSSALLDPAQSVLVHSTRVRAASAAPSDLVDLADLVFVALQAPAKDSASTAILRVPGSPAAAPTRTAHSAVSALWGRVAAAACALPPTSVGVSSRSAALSERHWRIWASATMQQ